MSEDLSGRQLGKYELHNRIGRGGMAEVYKAYHASLDRYVAIKVLHPFLSEDPEFKERFEREARNIAQLRHPNIVQVYDFDFEPTKELYYMVMEYIDGLTLRARLMQLNLQGEQFAVPEAMRITKDMANALAYAHTRNMIHRDIKPGNIIIDKEGRVVLTDFGIARIVSGPHMTASGTMIGTPAYMSPEQGLGQPGDHRSDIYSLGIVLYQMLVGTIPFDADTPIAIILKHVNDPLPSPTSINSEIPNGLERILYKALAKSPEDRYQNIEEMIYHLDHLEVASQQPLPPSDMGHPSATAMPSISAAVHKSALSQDIATSPMSSRQRGGCLLWLALLLLAISAMGGGAYLSFMGILSDHIAFLPGVKLTLADSPSTTPPFLTPVSITEALTPTPELGTAQIDMTIDTLATLVSTPPNNLTPDMTATILACDYDYEILEQIPENGAFYPELTTLTKRIIIINDSKCPLDDDTRLVFSEGYQLGGPDFIEFNQELQPGDEFAIELQLRTPIYNLSIPIIRSTWLIVLPNGIQVGPPLTFELAIIQSSGTTGSP